MKELVYSAFSRCPCGAGLAYEVNGESGRPIEGYWDCADILNGTAIRSGEANAVKHTGQLPFTFYKVIPETSPRAQGATTRHGC